jgi:hypothetical protein
MYKKEKHDYLGFNECRSQEVLYIPHTNSGIPVVACEYITACTYGK